MRNVLDSGEEIRYLLVVPSQGMISRGEGAIGLLSESETLDLGSRQARQAAAT